MADIQLHRKPLERTADAIAARVAAFRDEYVPPEGVQILNPGRFRIERMRGVEAKNRNKTREKVNG